MVCAESAKDVALKIVKEIAKDPRAEYTKMAKANESFFVSDGLATKKQREALHKFGIKEILENLSKKEQFRSKKNVEELNAKWGKSQ